MDSSYPYNGCLTAEQFLYREIRIIAKMFLEEVPLTKMIEIAKSENFFQYPTERQISRMTRACYKRLVALDNRTLVEEIANAPAVVAKQINLYAIMRYNRIVWEFMLHVIGEKYENQDYSYEKKDLNVFFTRLQEQDDEVATWSDKTISKIKQVLTKMLIEAEFLDDIKSTTLNHVYLQEELANGINENNDRDVLKAFNYFG